ncbi:MAG: glycerol-3-phosphate 1-O-acyltransferase PlsY [Finegoldia sp.]|nr:glycerol-3-phosphate 1-O-acyltransferase PlsY [Finegoldia sp.]
MKILFLIIIGYFIGNINGAILLSKILYHEDVRSKGSGNAGTTNGLRNYGKKFAIITFMIDFFKGFISAYIGYKLLGEIGIPIGGISSVIGHIYPILYGFRGGKGLACSAGVVLMISPIFLAVMTTIFALIVIISRYVSLGSISIAILVMLYGLYNIIFKKEIYAGVTFVILGFIVFFKHKSNIQRLLNKTESKIF